MGLARMGLAGMGLARTGLAQRAWRQRAWRERAWRERACCLHRGGVRRTRRTLHKRGARCGRFMRDKLTVPPPEQCLPGRAIKMAVPAKHFVNGNPLEGPYPAGLEMAVFGLGCFWGAERKFWEAPGVWTPRSAMPAAAPQPDLRRSVQRPHRPYRGRARRLRPQADQL